MAVRLPFLGTPLSVDEGGYAAVARFWARGSALYSDVWVDRPQGLVLLYRAAEALFGTGGEAVRLLATAWAAGLVMIVGLLVATLAGRRAGLVAAGLVAVVSVAPRLEGFAANGELLAALPSAAALLVFALWLTGRAGGWAPFAAGVLAGCAVLVKQSGYDGGGTILVWLALAAWRGWRPRPEALRALGLVVVGGALPVALAALHGALTDLGDWWFAVAGYRLSVESVATGSVTERLSLLGESLLRAWPVVLPLAVLAPLGAAAARRRPERLVLLIWPLLSLTGFALGGLFHGHYYVGLVAPSAGLAALGLERLGRRHGAARARLALAALCVPLVVAAWPAYSADTAAERSLESTDDPRILGDQAVGRWLRERTRPGEPIYALYADASLYAAADRPPAFRYLWYLGVQRIPGALEDLRALLRGPHAPRYVAVYHPTEMIDKTGQMERILLERYRPVATVAGVPILEHR